MRRGFALAIVMATVTAGCAGPGALGRAASRHEERAKALSEVGDGEGAAYELWRAQNLRQEAEVRTQRRSTWFWSDLTLN